MQTVRFDSASRKRWARVRLYIIAVCVGMLAQLSGTSAHANPELPGSSVAAAYPVPAVLVQAADSIVSAAGYIAQVQPVEEDDPVRSVQRQHALAAYGAGNVILWPGKWPRAVDNFAALVAEAAKHPTVFTHVYLIANDGDEIFWCKDRGVCMGQDEDTLLAAALLARAKGLKTICTFLPDVVLHPEFKPRDINAMCHGIAVDVYFSIRPTVPDLGGCRFSDNMLANLWHCSIAKLERMGHHGPKGCIAQAFALHSQSTADLRAGLTLQRQALTHAAALGCDYIAPWGRYLSAAAYAAEPDLMPLPAELVWMVQP